MNNWEIVWKVKAAAPNNEMGWAAMDAVWGWLEGQVTRSEAVEAMTEAGIEDADGLLGEIQPGEVL